MNTLKMKNHPSDPVADTLPPGQTPPPPREKTNDIKASNVLDRWADEQTHFKSCT